jgi:hypothetical protein
MKWKKKKLFRELWFILKLKISIKGLMLAVNLGTPEYTLDV